MGTFMSSSKRVIVKSVSDNRHVQIDNATTLSFYIAERVQNTTITSIDYQVEKITGRSSEVLTPWTSVSMVDVSNDLYEFDYTVVSVTDTDKLKFRFKIIDVDGLESFVDITSISIIS